MGSPRTDPEAEGVAVPEAPGIPGLRFRRFRGEDEYPAMIDVFNRSMAADRAERVTTLEETANLYHHFPNSDPERDLLMAEVHGQLVGYVRTTWREETEGDEIYKHWAALVQEWRGRGIGRAFLRHAERRLREVASMNASRARRLFQAVVIDADRGALRLFSTEGYAPVRYTFRMLRPTLEGLPEAPLPPGLEVRPAQPEHHRAIWEANVEGFRDHWGEGARSEVDYERWLGEPTADPGLWQVAWDGDRIAGMVLNFINASENAESKRLRGYTEDICVRKPWRRRGLARALIARSLRVLKERGMSEAALSVDAENRSGALGLYESLGYRPAMRWTILRKPLPKV